jgi:hypothetical protein
LKRHRWIKRLGRNESGRIRSGWRTEGQAQSRQALSDDRRNEALAPAG